MKIDCSEQVCAMKSVAICENGVAIFAFGVAISFNIFRAPRDPYLQDLVNLD